MARERFWLAPGRLREREALCGALRGRASELEEELAAMRAHAADLELLVVAEPPQLPDATELAGLHELLRERLRIGSTATRKSVCNALIESPVVHGRQDNAPTFRRLAAQPAEQAMAAAEQTSTEVHPSTAEVAVAGSVLYTVMLGGGEPSVCEPRRFSTAVFDCQLRVRGRATTFLGLRESLSELVDLLPGVAVSVDDVVAQLGRAGLVRDRGTVSDWLQTESLDEAGAVFRVVRGYYAPRDLVGGDSVPSCPVAPMPETEARVLIASASLQNDGRTSWALLELVAEVARCGPALSRRRLHDVVTAMRVADEPSVLRVAHGRFRATGD